MTKQEDTPSGRLLMSKPSVVNVGLAGFVKDLQDCDIEVVQVDWTPPADGDPEMAALLAKLGT